MKKIFVLLVLLSLLLYGYTDNRSLKVKKMQELEQRVALVIGNNVYESFSTLKNPINDARAIKESLKRKKFEVIYFENVSQKNFKRAIKKFANKLSLGGVGLFYFAGHGIQINGENYLIPSDADIADKDDVDGESVPVAYLTRKLKKAGNRLNIIILDACRNDPFSRGSNGGLAPISARGTYIAYATEAGKVAKDGNDEHGVFTKNLIKYMEEPITIDEVFKKTRTAVYNETNGEQFPATYNQVINGSFFFTLPKEKKATVITDENFKSKNTQKYLLKILPTPKDAKIEITNIDMPYNKNMRLKKGEYNIQVSKDGYETKTGNINLSGDYILKVKLNKIAKYKSSSAFLDVVPTDFTLNITTTPKDAKIEIEGILEEYYPGIRLSKGRYNIKIYKDGYIPKNGVIILDKNYELKVVLNKIKYSSQATSFRELPKKTKLINVFLDDKLMWQDAPDNISLKVDDLAASKYCKNLRLNNFSDWKLPTNEMLEKLKDKQKMLKYIVNEKYWSDYGKVDFSTNTIDAFLNTNDYVTEFDLNHVRCVRER